MFIFRGRPCVYPLGFPVFIFGVPWFYLVGLLWGRLNLPGVAPHICILQYLHYLQFLQYYLQYLQYLGSLYFPLGFSVFSFGDTVPSWDI